jgi:DNA-binding MarR family transcriptional regulator
MVYNSIMRNQPSIVPPGRSSPAPSARAVGRAQPAAANDADLPRLDQQLCFALYSASLAMTRVYKPLLAQLELTYPQYLVMLVLWQAERDAAAAAEAARGALRVSDIGSALFLDSGTLTPLLKRLEKQGLIERRRGLRDDEREVFIALTESGRMLREQAKAVPRALLDKTGCDLPELGRLVRRLAKLRGELLAQAEADGPYLRAAIDG